MSSWDWRPVLAFVVVVFTFVFGAILLRAMPSALDKFVGSVLSISAALSMLVHRNITRQMYARGISSFGFSNFYRHLGAEGVRRIYLCFWGGLLLNGLLILMSGFI